MRKRRARGFGNTILAMSPCPSSPLLLLVLTGMLALCAPPCRFAAALEEDPPQWRDAHFSLTNEFTFHFAHFGFYRGGSFELEGRVRFEGLTAEQIGNRSMTYLYICKEDEYRAVLRGSTGRLRQQEWGFCSNGMFLHRNLCRSIPIGNVRGEGHSGYHESLHTVGTLASKDIYHFIVVNCESWGTKATNSMLRSCLTAENHPTQPVPSTTPAASGGSGQDGDGGSSCFYPNFADRKIDANFRFKFRNPGSWLSYTEEPFLPLYLSFLVMWCGLTLVWWGNILRFSRRRHVVTLQRKIHNLPILKVVCVALGYMLWRVKEHAIVSDQVYLTLYFFVLVSRIIYTCAFAEVMLLISKGWQITRASLRRSDYMYHKLMLLAYAAAYGMYNAVADSSDVNRAREALIAVLVLTIMFLMILYTIWFGTSQQLNILAHQLNLVRAYQINPRTTPVFIKFRMYRQFRNAYAIYLIASAVADVLTATSVRATPWTPVMMDEIMDLLIFAGIGWTFRARDFSPYFSPVQRIAAPPPRRNAHDPPRRDSQLQSWHPGMGLPEPPEHLFHPNRSRVVVFINPDDEHVVGAAHRVAADRTLNPGSFIVPDEPKEAQSPASVSSEADGGGTGSAGPLPSATTASSSSSSSPAGDGGSEAN